MHVWSITCLPDRLDAFLDSLAELDPLRLVVTRTPGKLRQTIQYYAETEHEARRIAGIYGGAVKAVSDAWKTSAPAHAPIRIRDRLLVVETEGIPPDPREIVIPAGLAFGTGDHPTTASCLRLLCDVAKSYADQKWTMLDVGTGSGLLAIAAKKLGAARVEGFDYDPFAIRTSKENALRNAVSGIRWQRQDLTAFEAGSPFDVMAANIFSELFSATWSRIFPAVAGGGFFILSGILRFQADDCRGEIVSRGFKMRKEVRLGKWVTFLAQRDE